MNRGQTQFFGFIMDRAQEDKLDDMKALLEEGFAKQDHGTFTPEYLDSYMPKMLGLLKPEHVTEVRTVTEQFGKYNTE